MLTSTAASKFTMLTFTSGFPSEDRLEQVFREWFVKLQVDSGGRIQVSNLNTSGIPQNMMTGGMGGFTDLTELRDNVDWVWAISEIFSGKLPLWRALGSFVYGTDMSGSLKACTQVFNEFQEMQAEFANRDMKLLGTFAAYGNSIQTVEKPVRTLSDLNDLRIGGAMSLGPFFKQFDAIIDNVPAGMMGTEYTTLAANLDKADGVVTLPEFLLNHERRRNNQIFNVSSHTVRCH